MFATVQQKVSAALIALLAVGLVVFVLLYRHEKNAHFDASLARDRAEAQADVSKKIVDAKVQRVLGDTTAAWQRRVIQERQRGDSLDKVLGTARTSLTNIGITIDKGTGKASGAVHVVYVPVSTGSPPGTQPVEVRQSHFDVKAGVFNVAADVTLPAPPASGTMEATVTAPPIPLSIRSTCGAVTDGVRRADVVVTGPTWAPIGITHVEADPAVCNPGMKLQTRQYPLWQLVASDLLAGYVGYKLGQQHVTVTTAK